MTALETARTIAEKMTTLVSRWRHSPPVTCGDCELGVRCDLPPSEPCPYFTPIRDERRQQPSAFQSLLEISVDAPAAIFRHPDEGCGAPRRDRG